MDSTEFAIDPELMRLAMRQWASGVTIVSAHHDGERHGMTVSSFTSISLTPPLVLVSLEWGSRTQAMVEQSRCFGVSILNGRQQEISDRFAGRMTEYIDRFADLETFTLQTGSPLLSGGLAAFDCKVVSAYQAGNHTLYIGEVLAAQTETQEEQPLLYYNRAYHRLHR
ncbi:MAG TPA: flavin reductase family protein [Anaerolineaceae bacterium]